MVNSKMHERMGGQGSTVGRGKGEWGRLSAKTVQLIDTTYHARVGIRIFVEE